MKKFVYTVPKDHRAERACMLHYKGIPICKLIECVDVFEGLKSYLFIPDWDNYAKAEEAGMCDIQGINADIRWSQYTYIHRLPAFLYTRFIPLDRSDWQYHYGKVGMQNHQDQWEFMVRMKGRCMEDPITVERCELDD